MTFADFYGVNSPTMAMSRYLDITEHSKELTISSNELIRASSSIVLLMEDTEMHHPEPPWWKDLLRGSGGGEGVQSEESPAVSSLGSVLQQRATLPEAISKRPWAACIQSLSEVRE